ncbi:Tetratricopeptide repeat protein [Roseovarius albus]|uniref:Tetratricopeptide repeat protein n=1 Tax=Roseovarius albus TaxID=1247867 RepID=A0A1X6YFQ1_9RHOB|nr:tetratricopeptide repeat protein [Roseovarius albus]SLN20096.1 Tetratricopeptide repeat protein [Roseovarius albus]
MTRAGAAFAIIFSLAACSEGFNSDPDNPYAPGLAKNEESVDNLLVARRLMYAKEYELAIDAYSRAALENGLSSDVLAGIGTANLGLGRLDTAERLLRQALEENETSPEIWNNIGVILIEKGEIPEAEQMFRRAFALDNGESDAIRDNLRLALAKSENSAYDGTIEQDYKVVRRGSGDFTISQIP